MMYLSPVSDHRGSRANLKEGFSIEKLYDLIADVLGSLINESKLAEKTDEAAVLKFTHELTLEPIS